MSQPKDYKHYLRYWDGAAWQYWYDNAGTVTYTASATELDYAPEGWQEYEIILERGFTYYGLFTSFTTPLKFVKDGAYILRHLKYTFGIETKVELYIEKLDRSDWTYAEFFRGDLDMSKTQDEYDTIVAPVIEGGFIEKLKSRENTNYTYDLQHNADVQFIEHDGIELQAKLSWTGLSGTNGGGFPDLVYYDTEGTNVAFKMFNQNSALPGQQYIIENIYGSSVDVDLKIDYDVTFHVDGGAPNPAKFILRITVATALFVTYSDTDLFTAPSNTTQGNSNTYYGTVTDTITVPAGHILSVRYVAYTGVGYLVHPEFDVTTNGMECSAYFVNRYETTYIPALKASKVFELLIASINDDATTLPTATTILLDGDHYLTSGDGLRSLTNSRFTINFADFFTWVNCKFGATFYYDRTSNIAYLEAKANAFDETLNPDYPSIGTVVNFKCIPFTEEAATTIKIGSKAYNYDAKKDDDHEITNGKDEFNTLHEYSTPLTRLGGVIKDYTSSIRDDIHGIELVRINLDGKELADASSDNEVYALHCDSTLTGSFNDVFGTSFSTIGLYRKAINLTPGASYWEVEHIFSEETAYNFIYSPARCMYANGNYLRSLYKLNDADEMVLEYTAKSNPLGLRMITNEGATPTIIGEGNNIGIQSLCANGDVLFQPFIFEVTIREDINMYSIINSHPFKYINFTYLEDTYSGYILKAVSKPTFRGETQLRLLCTRATTITNLIRQS